MTTLDPDEGVRLIEACDQYPYHELVAYACGHTIGELREWLELGAAGADEGLAIFARDYCRKDAEFAGRIFATIREICEAGMKGNIGPLWKWFDTRWPCDQPLAITTLLSGKRAELLSLDENFRDAEQDVQDSLHRTGWFQANELGNPSVELAAILEAAGYRRESDARPEPHPAPTS